MDLPNCSGWPWRRRKARLEKTVDITQLRLALETEEERRAYGFNFIFVFKKTFFSRTELARPVMGTIFLVNMYTGGGDNKYMH